MEEHGGWKNRETWQANLWISNEEGLHYQCVGQDASAIRDTVSDWLGDMGGREGQLGDITGLWMGRVDWDAIADALNDC